MSNVTVTYIDETQEQDKTRIISADRVRYDMHRARNNWPPATESPFLALHYCTWAALKRTKCVVTDFEDWLMTVDEITTDETASEEPEPFRD